MILLLLSGLAWAIDMPDRLPPIASVPGQCAMTYPIETGKLMPSTILGQDSKALCSAIAVPLSDYSDLLATESWGKAVSERYTIDITALEADRDWYKAKLEEANKPLPFLERPGTQRWLGRIETLVTVGVVTVGLGTAYHYSSGGFR
tara:strand:+ start:348 stop:788 length:441 start_codon:yes stop_codon:yes gene_type:complete